LSSSIGRSRLEGTIPHLEFTIEIQSINITNNGNYFFIFSSLCCTINLYQIRVHTKSPNSV